LLENADDKQGNDYKILNSQYFFVTFGAGQIYCTYLIRTVWKDWVQLAAALKLAQCFALPYFGDLEAAKIKPLSV